MGLKLYHIDNRGSHGELDGQPFRLSTDSTGWRAEIGEKGRTWIKDGAFPFDHSKAINDVRILTYNVIAIYRSFQRFGQATA
ncbi:hypothetical protein KUV57_11865 [Epibacterium sp. DP7N7-1]|nr:hypothetical protein [Epibacterium sp. DP7N7-1]